MVSLLVTSIGRPVAIQKWLVLSGCRKMVDRMTAAELIAMQSAPKAGNKFSAQRTEVDGIKFDSKKEAARWADLNHLVRAGEIADLHRQVVIPLEGRDGPVLTRKGRQMRLTVDFSYRDVKSGVVVFEDTKGCITRDYEVRRGVAASQGIEVLET